MQYSNDKRHPVEESFLALIKYLKDPPTMKEFCEGRPPDIREELLSERIFEMARAYRFHDRDEVKRFLITMLVTGSHEVWDEFIGHIRAIRLHTGLISESEFFLLTDMAPLRRESSAA